MIIQLHSTSFYTYTPNQTDFFINCHGSKPEKIRIDGFNIISLTSRCLSSLNQYAFISGVEIENNIILKQNDLNLHLRDLIKIQEYQETKFLKEFEEEQDETRKPIDMVDVSKNFHLKQLSKKNKMNAIFGTSSTVVTIILLVISAIILNRFCAKNMAEQEITSLISTVLMKILHLENTHSNETSSKQSNLQCTGTKRNQ